MKRSFEGLQKSERAIFEPQDAVCGPTREGSRGPLKNVGSEAHHRHFSGSKAFDFPAHYGLFPLQQQPESHDNPQ
jgi:hypothetical protein